MSKALRGGRVATVMVALVLATVVGPWARPAVAGPVEEALLLTLSNTVRATVGAPPLTLDPQLSAVAQNWSNQMASVGGISHNPSLKDQVFGWSRLAENVGMGPSIEVIHQALVNSPSHYTNMTNPLYDHVGLAVTVAGLTVYVTEVFVQRAAAPVVTSPPPAPPAPAVITTPPPPKVTVPPAPKPTTTTTIAPPPPPEPEPPVVTPQSTPLPPVPVSPSPWIEMVFQLLRGFDPITP